MADFVNVKINVNGKIHNVKMEKGVTVGKHVPIGNDDYRDYRNDLFSIGSDNTLRVESESCYSEYVYSKTNMITMSDAEFQIFKNIADNVQEGNGNEIILSTADIKKSQEQYSQNKFRADISKGLTDKYVFEREYQELMENGVKACGYKKSSAIYDTNAVNRALGNEVQEKYDESYKALINVTYDGNTDDGNTYYGNYRDIADKYMKESANGKVKLEYDISDGIFGISYVYLDKNGHDISKYHKTSASSTSLEQKALITTECYTTKEGKNLTIKKDADGKIEGIEVRYKENKKNIIEYRNYNGNLEKKEVVFKNSKGQDVLEEYNSNNLLTRRTYGTYDYEHEQMEYRYTIKENYDNGKLESVYNRAKDRSTYYKNGEVTKVQDKANKTTTYYENGKIKEKVVETKVANYTYDGNKKIKSVYDQKYETNFDVRAWTNIKRNDVAKKYYEEFKGMSAKDIADRIHSQIYGPSNNKKTSDMLDGIPTEKLVDVLKEYNKITNIIGDTQDSLTIALSKEWGMSVEVIGKVMKRAFASYIQSQNKYFSVNTDTEKLSDEEAVKVYNKIETNLIGTNKYVKTEDDKLELKDYWYNLKKTIFGE